ncbi:unnamed protein product [Darwinula stevensoni]|uniref:CUB domain-containing protein n=1 Tax=Darwinula stevensoni TaxID=69355 RepID=A0A7R9AAY2_9CRUS|nr:unnamed protein product [Darwinula stevensoni]CAG0898872.1 unnamed protein product [Darwinula stevensoni]
MPGGVQETRVDDRQAFQSSGASQDFRSPPPCGATRALSTGRGSPLLSPNFPGNFTSQFDCTWEFSIESWSPGQRYAHIPFENLLRVKTDYIISFSSLSGSSLSSPCFIFGQVNPSPHLLGFFVLAASKFPNINLSPFFSYGTMPAKKRTQKKTSPPPPSVISNPSPRSMRQASPAPPPPPPPAPPPPPPAPSSSSSSSSSHTSAAPAPSRTSSPLRQPTASPSRSPPHPSSHTANNAAYLSPAHSKTPPTIPGNSSVHSIPIPTNSTNPAQGNPNSFANPLFIQSLPPSAKTRFCSRLLNARIILEEDEFRIGCLRLRVEEFVIQPRIIRCFKCLQYGRYIGRCKADRDVCSYRSGKGHTQKTRQAKLNVLHPKCSQCQGAHAANAAACPKRQEKRLQIAHDPRFAHSPLARKILAEQKGYPDPEAPIRTATPPARPHIRLVPARAAPPSRPPSAPAPPTPASADVSASPFPAISPSPEINSVIRLLLKQMEGIISTLHCFLRPHPHRPFLSCLTMSSHTDLEYWPKRATFQASTNDGALIAVANDGNNYSEVPTKNLNFSWSNSLGSMKSPPHLTRNRIPPPSSLIDPQMAWQVLLKEIT